MVTSQENWRGMLNIIARVTHHPVGFAILVLFWPNQTTVSVDYPFSESHDPPKFLYPVKYVFQLMYSTGPLGDLWHGMWGQAQSYAYRFLTLCQLANACKYRAKHYQRSPLCLAPHDLCPILNDILNWRSCRVSPFFFDGGWNGCILGVSCLYHWMLESFRDSSRCCSLALATPFFLIFKHRKPSDPIQLIFKPYQKFVRKTSNFAVLRPLEFVGSSSDKDSSLWIITSSTPLSAPIGRGQDRNRRCLGGRAQNDFALMNKPSLETRSGGWKMRGLTTTRSLKSYSAMMMMIGRPTTNDDQ